MLTAHKVSDAIDEIIAKIFQIVIIINDITFS